MKGSGVVNFGNEICVVIKNAHVEFCDGNKAAAWLIGYYSHQHNLLLADANRLMGSNYSTNTSALKETLQVELPRNYTYQELLKSSLGLFNRTKLYTANILLMEKEVISYQEKEVESTNPEDTIFTVSFYPEKLNAWIKKYKDKAEINIEKHINCTWDEKKSAELVIGSGLTEAQSKVIRELSKSEISKHPEFTLDDIYERLAAIVLDSECFSKARRNFIKKVDTIKKRLTNGKLDLSSYFSQMAFEKRKKYEVELIHTYNQLSFGNTSVKKFIECSRDKDEVLFNKALRKAEFELESFERKHPEILKLVTTSTGRK